MARKLGVAFYPDFELLDVYGPLEMFGSLNVRPSSEEIAIVSIAQAPGSVTSTQGPATVVDHTFNDTPALDLLLVPGGIGTVAQLANDAYLDFIRARAAEAEVVMSVCSGSALLAKAGLLDGKRATSNKMFFDLAVMQSAAVDWVESARWVEDGKYVTSSGVSAGIDMALAVIARLYGEQSAEQIAAYTEYQWHRDADTDPFMQFLNKGDLSAI